jgi:hypothetical protein
VGIDRGFEIVVILTNVLLTNVETSENSFLNKCGPFNNEGPFLITETAAPNEAPQSLNPRVRG